MADETPNKVRGKEEIIESLQASCAKYSSELWERKQTIATQAGRIEEQGAEIERLKGELSVAKGVAAQQHSNYCKAWDQHDEQGGRWALQLNEMQVRAEAAEASRDRLRDAVRKYGDHELGCEVVEGVGACSCGWGKLKAALAGGEEE